jgi:HlyD family secretion protein
VLVRFDTALLQAQLEQTQAALELAQRSYDLVVSGTPQEQRQAAVTAARLELESAAQALDDLNEKAGLAAAQAEQRVAAADKARDQASDRLESLIGEADPEDIERAQAEVVIANDRLKKAREDYDRYLKYQDKNVSRAIMQIKVADAQTALDAKVTRLNNLLGHANQIEVTLAEADVKLAEAALADAHRELEKVIDGPDPEALTLAQDRLAAAQARLEAAEAGPTAEQLAVAKAQLDAARAAVEVIQVQMGKLLLAAPMDGIILTRSVEPGEFVSPGVPLLALARLDELSITIYVPEDHYGTISLGENARVSVDSFPGETFEAAVVHIASQAEYTPRNVQTAEGRRTTVFAVKLAIENPEGKLKPGMPADVTFGE